MNRNRNLNKKEFFSEKRIFSLFRVRISGKGVIDMLPVKQKEDTFEKENELLFRMLERGRPESAHSDLKKPPVQEAHTGHPVITAMLLTFAVLLVSAAVLIGLDLTGITGTPKTAPIPEEEASLCSVSEAGTGGQEEYRLEIDGDGLSVYRNGRVERQIRYPLGQLSDYDRALLSSGIGFSDENALKKALEDYTS